MALEDFKIFDMMLEKLAQPEEIEAYKYTFRNYGKSANLKLLSQDHMIFFCCRTT